MSSPASRISPIDHPKLVSARSLLYIYPGVCAGPINFRVNLCFLALLTAAPGVVGGHSYLKPHGRSSVFGCRRLELTRYAYGEIDCSHRQGMLLSITAPLADRELPTSFSQGGCHLFVCKRYSGSCNCTVL